MLERYGCVADARIEESVSNKYLVLKIADEAKPITHQIEMLSVNEVPGMAKLNKRVNNGETELWYDISACKTVSDSVKNEISKGQFTSLFKGIADSIQASDKFFLDEAGFVLDRDVLFVDKDMNPYLIYLPVEGIDSDIKSGIRELFDFASSKVEVTAGAGDMLQILSREVKDEAFNLKSFAGKLQAYAPKQVKSATTPKAPTEVKPVVERIPMPTHDESTPVRPVAELVNAPSEAEAKKPQLKGSESALSAALGRADGKSGSKEKSKPKKEKQAAGGSKATLLTVLVQVVVIAALVGLYVSGMLDSFELTQKLGLVLLIVAIDGYAIYKIKQMPVPEGQQKEKPVKNKEKKTKKASGKPSKAEKPAPAKVSTLESESTDFLNDEKTAFIGADQAILRGRTAGFEGDFPMNTSPFVVGKSREGTNMTIANKHVSRHHLQIVDNAGQFLITDLGSTNGTFLNGGRLEANLQYPLNSGDVIKIGQCEYEFIIL